MQSVCKLQDEQLQLTITDHDQLRSCWVLKSNHEPFGPSRLRLAKQKALTKADVFSAQPGIVSPIILVGGGPFSERGAKELVFSLIATY